MASCMGGRTEVIDQDAIPTSTSSGPTSCGAYRGEIDALYAAGCRYLQLDDVSFAYLCDPELPRADDARAATIPTS